MAEKNDEVKTDKPNPVKKIKKRFEISLPFAPMKLGDVKNLDSMTTLIPLDNIAIVFSVEKKHYKIVKQARDGLGYKVLIETSDEKLVKKLSSKKPDICFSGNQPFTNVKKLK